MRSKPASPAWTSARGSSHASHSHRQGRAGGKGSVAWLLPPPAERGEGWRGGSVLARGVHRQENSLGPPLPSPLLPWGKRGRSLLARAIWSALLATRAISEQQTKQQKKVS